MDAENSYRVAPHTALSARIREKPYDTVVRLGEELGPRSPTSLQEARAAAYVDGRLRRAGLRVAADTFDAPVNAGWDATVMLAMAGLAAGVWWSLVWVGVALWAAAVALALVRVGRGEPLLVRHRTSQNIIGTQAVQTPRRRVVVLAALDTLPMVRGGMWWERLTLWPWWVQVGCAAAGMALAGMGWWWQALCVVPLVLPALGELARTRTAYSPGANHSAAALALLMATAETVAACEKTEIWLVALGASSGGAGLRDLLRRYPFERQQTVFIGLEGPGSGTPAVITREGVLLQHAADAELLRIAGAADAADPRIDLEPRPFRGPTLVRTVRNRNLRWMTLAGLDSAGQMPNRASSYDTPSAIDPDVLERSLRLITGVMRLIDRGAA